MLGRNYDAQILPSASIYVERAAEVSTEYLKIFLIYSNTPFPSAEHPFRLEVLDIISKFQTVDMFMNFKSQTYKAV
jgi:hypothetical protein